MTEPKSAHGEFKNIFLTEAEFVILTNKYGFMNTSDFIEQLSSYLKDKPKKNYASHYRTILAWMRKDGVFPAEPPSPKPPPDMEYLELKINGIHAMFKRDFERG